MEIKNKQNLQNIDTDNVDLMSLKQLIQRQKPLGEAREESLLRVLMWRKTGKKKKPRMNM